MFLSQEKIPLKVTQPVRREAKRAVEEVGARQRRKARSNERGIRVARRFEEIEIGRLWAPFSPASPWSFRFSLRGKGRKENVL